jgi:urease subunit gamma/beta
VRLTSWEEERLLIFSAAELARRHRSAGLLLNAPEAIAIICDAMLEAARAGASYAEVEAAGLAAIGPNAVMPGVRELVDDVRIEVLLEDGARLVVLVDPLGQGQPPTADSPGAIEMAREDAVGPASSRDVDLERLDLTVENTSRRAVRVSSHFPFDRVNARLVFDRAAAAGFRLDLPAGSSERWSPGETRTVSLVRYAATGITREGRRPATERPAHRRPAPGDGSRDAPPRDRR